MIANGELVSGAATEDGVGVNLWDRSFTIFYRALSSVPGTSRPLPLPVRAAAKPHASSGNGMRSPAFADSAGSTLFVTLRRLSVGCCSQSFDASVAANNGALYCRMAHERFRLILSGQVNS
jgi:hypothetical protein